MSEQGQLLIQKTREIVGRNPLHVHRSRCLYVENGCPSCLLGQAMWELGWISEGLETSRFNDTCIEAFLEDNLGIALDLDELFWLEAVQTQQDRHHAWGTAIQLADADLVLYLEDVA